MSRPIGALVAATLILMPATAFAQKAQRAAAMVTPVALPVEAPKVTAAGSLVASVALADIGFISGFRFSNLGGRQELFLPLPPGVDLSASVLNLSIDDITAYDARRSLEILVNDRSAGAIALDGKSMGRQVRVPLQHAKSIAGYLKLTFSYSGAATQDRCIDVRSIGDSLTVRPESSIEIEIGPRPLDVATTAALLPRNVAIILSSRTLGSADLAGALTIGRALRSTGRKVSFHHGFESVNELGKRDDARRWTQGLILIGEPSEIAPFIEAPGPRVAGPATSSLGALTAARAAGLPAIIVTDTDRVRAGRLLASSLLSALRGVPAATVGDSDHMRRSSSRVTFEELNLAPAVADVFGRADITFTIAARALPAGTKPSRLALDVMVAPDGAGEKAVASVFIDDRLLGSTVAAVGEPTKFDLALPDGLVGTMMNVRVVVQRRSAQGDCRFEPQGYPAQVLGSSSVILTDATDRPHDFADMSAWWVNGIEVWLPSPAGERPGPAMALISDALAQLSPPAAEILVKFTNNGDLPAPTSPFIAVSPRPPSGTAPRVRFDQGRVVVTDKNNKTLLNLGGFAGGAVAQLVSAGSQPGLWLKPLAPDNALPAPDELRLDRGDVAFIDQSGVALAMSSERDTLVRITYPDNVSWLQVAERFHPWMIGAVWALITIAFLFGLQRILRRRAANAGE